MPTFTFPVTAGQTYRIVVDGVDGTSASFSIAMANLGGGDGELPEGALGMLDFKNGVYKWGEDTYTSNQVIDTPAAVIPNVGLWVQEYDLVSPFGGLPAVGIIDSPFLDYLIAGDFTVAIEFYGDWFNQVLFMDGYSSGAVSIASVTNSYILVYDQGELRELELSGTVTGGIDFYGFIALTRTAAKIATRISTGEHAGTTYEDASPAGEAPLVSTAAFFGGDASSAYGSMLVTRMVFYPAQDNAALGDIVADPLLEPPPNDNFADAITLTLNTPHDGHNFLCTKEVDEPNHDGLTSWASSVWFTFTPDSSGSRTVTVGGPSDFSGAGPVVAIYTGSALAALTPVASDNDWPGAAVTWSAVGGTTYRIAVAGAFARNIGGERKGGQGPFTIEVT